MMQDPYYQEHIFFCTNQRPQGHKRGCCYSKDSERLRAYMKAAVKEAGLEGVRVNKAGCMDRCEAGPIMVIYPEGVWYRPETTEDIDKIIESHLKNKKPVAHLKLLNQD